MTRRSTTPGWIAVISLLGWIQPSAAAQIKPADDAPQPYEAAESLRLFEVEEGFQIELVASEPLIADPSGIAFDAAGRLYVCELHGYNLEGHLDIVELNKTGVLDMEVRRIQANPDAVRQAEKGTFGVVKRLEDDDGDGRMDRATVWASDLPPCYGLIAARDGVIAICDPEIVYLADYDGDGEVDHQETLFRGFTGQHPLEAHMNSPRWGLDNWIYVIARGAAAGEITGPHLENAVSLGNTDFRFRADGSAFEAVTGNSHGFGQAFTDFGDRFVIDNSSHVKVAIPIPARYLARNTAYGAPGTVAVAARYHHVFPASEPHPWRWKRSQRPEWVQFYGRREAMASGSFTAACGPLIYRGDAFPEAYRGHHFSCDAQQNLIHRAFIQREESGWTATRASPDTEGEFVRSPDKWFRPVQLEPGPDGALYIVDMYREIIEDYSAIPRYLQQQYGLDQGGDRGRIWRVFPKDIDSSPAVDLAIADVDRWVTELSNPDAWWRTHAQRCIVESDAQSAIPLLRDRLRNSPLAAGRVHVLYTLEGLSAISRDDLLTALADDHYGVRLHALRIADTRLDDALVAKMISMTEDPDPAVRLQLALSLGESDRPLAISALAEIARNHASDRWMDSAILSAPGDRACRLLSSLIDTGWAEPLMNIVGARRNTEEISKALTVVTATLDPDVQTRALRGLIEGSAHTEKSSVGSEEIGRALTQLASSSSSAVRTAAFEAMGALGLTGDLALTEVFHSARSTALDPAVEADARLSAMSILAHAPFDVARDLAELLAPDQPLEIQLAVVSTLDARQDEPIAPLLLQGWKAYSPKIRTSVLDSIFRRNSRLPSLLDALDRQRVIESDVSGFQRLRLLNHPDAAIRSRAQALLEGDEDSVDLAPYRQHLGTGSAARGTEVFENLCAKCHRLGDRGVDVGPDLSAVRSRADETLLRDLLWPNERITSGFGAYLVDVASGETLTGTLAAETATSITLRHEEGEETTVLRKDIVYMQASTLSMMPNNMEELLTPQQAADVIAFLRDEAGAYRPDSRILFDEEDDFISMLDEGEGVLRIETESPHRGARYLSVTPPQAFSASLEGWRFRICEHPQPGEYRYLQLAWRTDGDGVLVELAANGHWPPADQPTRRYYSGQNTTSWGAHQVDTLTPKGWTVITVDLWRDNGDFTLTGIAPTAMGGKAYFDHIALLRTID